MILTAAVLLELVSGIQYFYTRGLLEDELESHAESELTMKAILIKGTLNAAENALSDHVWDALRNLEKPDSLFHVAERLTIAHPLFVSSAVAMPTTTLIAADGLSRGRDGTATRYARSR